MVEREIEDKQRLFSSLYVDQVVDLLKRVNQGDDNVHILSAQLDTIFIKAAETLTKDDIFSRESFRTFSEAYDIARETIERKKRDSRDSSALAQSNVASSSTGGNSLIEGTEGASI